MRKQKPSGKVILNFLFGMVMVEVYDVVITSTDPAERDKSAPKSRVSLEPDVLHI